MLKLIKVTMNQSEYFISTRTQVDRFGRESERYNLHSDASDAETFQADHAESIVNRLKAHVSKVEIKEAA